MPVTSPAPSQRLNLMMPQPYLVSPSSPPNKTDNFKIVVLYKLIQTSNYHDATALFIVSPSSPPNKTDNFKIVVLYKLPIQRKT